MNILEDLSIIADGDYVGFVCGYTVHLAFNNGNYSSKLTIDEGIRGFGEYIFRIENGKGFYLTSSFTEISKLKNTYRVRPQFYNEYKRILIKAKIWNLLEHR